MKQATQSVRDLARRLLDQGEQASRGRAGPSPAQRALDVLRVHLATLVGVAGFQALVSRALALARLEARSLESVRVNADGSVEGLAEVDRGRDADDMAAGGEILVTKLLQLLATFIGEDLTLRLVRDAWPPAPLDDSSPDGEERPA